MAIQTLRDKNGNPRAFQVQIRIPGEKSESSTFTTFEAAEEHEENAMRAIRAARSGPATRAAYGRRSKPTGVVSLVSARFSTIADEFAKEEPEHRCTPYVRKLKEFVGQERVCDLDKEWTKAFCERMRKVKAGNRDNLLAEGTIGQYISMVRRICNWKAESLGIDKPRLGLTTEFLEPGWDDGRERRLRGDEEARIREELGFVGAKRLWRKGISPGARGRPLACARHYQLIFDFAIETCAREAEMVELPWNEVDLERRVWTLPARRSKTERRRKIYLTPRAVEVLKELWCDRELGVQKVFRRLPTTKGVCSTFHSAIVRLGIEDLVFHDLKHEGVTRHRIAKNFEPEVLMKMVGHSSPKMTMRYFNPEDEEVHAHLEAALLRRSVPAVASRQSIDESAILARFKGFLASVEASPESADDLSMTRSQLAARMRELMASPRERSARL